MAELFVLLMGGFAGRWLEKKSFIFIISVAYQDKITNWC